MKIPRYVVLNKKVGETPLSCAEHWRSQQSATYQNIPLAYAGRLDPMASGKLLILLGDECKRQDKYHALDKRYEFSMLFGIASDTHDVLGRLTPDKRIPHPTKTDIDHCLPILRGQITLPFPHFSAKTVKGKPLHMWTLENRLHEITIPRQQSFVYELRCTKVETKMRATIHDEVLQKVNSIPAVTDPKKALGNDFRRVDVRADWSNWRATDELSDRYTIAHFSCIASSGTYMRSLAAEIGSLLGTTGLAYHIERTHIGHYQKLGPWGIWLKKY
ncbi:MAG: tRNA pseudouridine synthase tRNA pseudouridine55 synthase [Candidatus Parcubacteria bacterium]|jgi:tRNA pseudouridine(55) synthase